MRSMRTVALVALITVSLDSGAKAEPPRRPRVPSGAVVHLYGDSITKGWGFGRYDDPSPLCRIQDIANLLAAANLADPPKFVRLAPREGEPSALSSEAVDRLIKVRISAGEIGPEDCLVYEDAGPHGSSYHDYRRKLASICEAAKGANRRVFLMTMFAYKPTVPESDYDAPTKDVPGKSINDAIRDEAEAQGVGCIDMDGCMDRLQEALKARGWGSTCHRDGIHPNVFGNTLMALVVLRALGADVGTWKLDAIEGRFRHNGSGGDVPDLMAWSWPKDPGDAERLELVRLVLEVANVGPSPVRELSR